MSTEYRLLDTCKTNYPADSLEFNPLSDYADVFAVATYKLVQEPGSSSSEDPEQLSNASTSSIAKKRKREGQIHLYKANEFQEAELNDELDESRTKIVSLATIDHPAAILDTRWTSHKVNGQSLLVVGDSIGHCTVYKAGLSSSDDEPAAPLDALSQFTPEDAELHPDLLVLSLDISSKLSHSESPSILLTYNTGAVDVVRLSPSSFNLEHVARAETAHSLEAWTCCWDHHVGNGDTVFWTGGDDATFRKWDLRVGTDSSVQANKSSHMAGVTSLLVPPVVSHPYYLFSGSYDEHMFLWDTRNFRPGRHLAEYVNDGGGVWRLKMLPDLASHDSETRPSMTLAVAGMHRGFDVVQVGQLMMPSFLLRKWSRIFTDKPEFILPPFPIF